MSPMATATAPSKTSVRASMADPKAEAAVQMLGVHKWYGEFHVLREINLHVRRSERIVICGPSGSGKSTMIRCINRLEEHQQGRIIVDGTELTNDLKKIDEIRREVGSSKSMIFGFMHKERAMATRCCWPPESWPGYFAACSGILTRLR